MATPIKIKKDWRNDNNQYFCLMRVIILFTFFLAPLFGLASFPIENETTEFINEVSNQTSDTKTHWYWTWWAAH